MSTPERGTINQPAPPSADSLDGGRRRTRLGEPPENELSDLSGGLLGGDALAGQLGGLLNAVIGQIQRFIGAEFARQGAELARQNAAKIEELAATLLPSERRSPAPSALADSGVSGAMRTPQSQAAQPASPPAAVADAPAPGPAAQASSASSTSAAANQAATGQAASSPAAPSQAAATLAAFAAERARRSAAQASLTAGRPGPAGSPADPVPASQLPAALTPPGRDTYILGAGMDTALGAFRRPAPAPTPVPPLPPDVLGQAAKLVSQAAKNDTLVAATVQFCAKYRSMQGTPTEAVAFLRALRRELPHLMTWDSDLPIFKACIPALALDGLKEFGLFRVPHVEDGTSVDISPCCFPTAVVLAIMQGHLEGTPMQRAGAAISRFRPVLHDADTCGHAERAALLEMSSDVLRAVTCSSYIVSRATGPETLYRLPSAEADLEHEAVNMMVDNLSTHLRYTLRSQSLNMGNRTELAKLSLSGFRRVAVSLAAELEHMTRALELHGMSVTDRASPDPTTPAQDATGPLRPAEARTGASTRSGESPPLARRALGARLADEVGRAPHAAPAAAALPPADANGAGADGADDEEGALAAFGFVATPSGPASASRGGISSALASAPRGAASGARGGGSTPRTGPYGSASTPRHGSRRPSTSSSTGSGSGTDPSVCRHDGRHQVCYAYLQDAACYTARGANAPAKTHPYFEGLSPPQQIALFKDSGFLDRHDAADVHKSLRHLIADASTASASRQ